MTYPKTPTLNAMKAVQPKSQAIGEFLEWLAEKGVRLGKLHVHDKNCSGWDAERGRYNPGLNAGCSFRTDKFEPFRCCSKEKLLAEFFEIDLAKAEMERRAVLDYVRAQHEKEAA
jgi:hypothetical protein